ncbi:MAG: hypothetical protein JHC73_02170 [Dolichospermum sp.]|nr:hypothetical protein [Dolichospermum sp.]
MANATLRYQEFRRKKLFTNYQLPITNYQLPITCSLSQRVHLILSDYLKLNV